MPCLKIRLRDEIAALGRNPIRDMKKLFSAAIAGIMGGILPGRLPRAIGETMICGGCRRTCAKLDANPLQSCHQ